MEALFFATSQIKSMNIQHSGSTIVCHYVFMKCTQQQNWAKLKLGT